MSVKRIVTMGLLVFLLGIGCVKFMNMQGVTPDFEIEENTTGSLETLSIEDFIDSIKMLLQAGTIDAVSKPISDLPSEKRKHVVETIIDPQSNVLINLDRKVALLVAVAAQSKDDISVAYELFDRLLVYQNQLPYQVALSVIAQFPEGIEIFNTWVIKQKENPESVPFINSLVEKGLKYIVQEGNIEALKTVLAQTSLIDRIHANQLLLYLVDNKYEPGFIAPLVVNGYADINVTDAQKFTPLMHAVLDHNMSMTKTLLEHGADPNYLSDPAIGTALQLALEKRFVDIELLLRGHGARE